MTTVTANNINASARRCKPSPGTPSSGAGPAEMIRESRGMSRDAQRGPQILLKEEVPT